MNRTDVSNESHVYVKSNSNSENNGKKKEKWKYFSSSRLTRSLVWNIIYYYLFLNVSSKHEMTFHEIFLTVCKRMTNAREFHIRWGNEWFRASYSYLTLETTRIKCFSNRINSKRITQLIDNCCNRLFASAVRSEAKDIHNSDSPPKEWKVLSVLFAMYLHRQLQRVFATWRPNNTVVEEDIIETVIETNI